jgi:hypothetical protein
MVCKDEKILTSSLLSLEQSFNTKSQREGLSHLYVTSQLEASIFLFKNDPTQGLITELKLLSAFQSFIILFASTKLS